MRHSNTPPVLTLLLCALLLTGWSAAYAEDEAAGDSSTATETKPAEGEKTAGGAEEEPECD